MKGLIATLAAAVLSLPAARTQAAETAPSQAPPVAAGNLTVGSGAAFRWQYHFDHNALIDSRRVGAATIALTEAGNLLRYDLQGHRITHERFGPVEATCLGQDPAGAVFAGYADGSIEQLDPATLAPTEVARLPGGEVVWIGFSGPGAGHLVGVTRSEKGAGLVPQGLKVAVHDRAARRTYPAPPPPKAFSSPTAFLLDRKGRLWLGGDQGEWGGWCERLDLRSGKLARIANSGRPARADADPWSGVYGFLELSDGQVWAYGGSSHMGVHSGFVARVDRATPQRLLTVGGWGKPAKPDPTRPHGPITGMLQDRTGQVIVLSYSNIFRTDARLGAWARIHRMELQYRWGRPDAMGSYPSVQAIHQLDSPGDFLFATIADGYTELVGDVERHLGVRGQLGVRSIGRIENSAAGTLYIPGLYWEPPLMLRSGSWEPIDLATPYSRHPDEPATIPPDTAWSDTRVLVDPAGTIYTVSAGATIPGTRATGTWRGGKAVTLGFEHSELTNHAALVTPDGQLWTLRSGKIHRFANGKWVLAGTFDDKGLDVSFDVHAVATNGPPWVLLDQGQKRVMLLSHGPGREHPALSALPITEGGAPLSIHAAIPWGKDSVLLATDRGLRLYDLAKRALAPAPLPPFSKPINALCRDRRGRLWIAGEGLWLVDGQTLHALDGLPTGTSPVEAIAPDPAHDDGVIASLNERGILFVHGGRVDR